MNEDYCSYELSKVLKAAGFDEPCDHYWCKVYTDSDEMAMRQASADDYNNDDWDVPHCSAPHIYHAQKWLREKKSIVVSVHPESKFLKDERTYKHTGWGYSILRINKNGIMTPGPIGHILMAKYEGALAEGIFAALELIKNGE